VGISALEELKKYNSNKNKFYRFPKVTVGGKQSESIHVYKLTIVKVELK
jgi:hypothetical protein